MMSQRLLLQHGEAMLNDIGLLKSSTVLGPGTINGFRALHPEELT